MNKNALIKIFTSVNREVNSEDLKANFPKRNNYSGDIYV